MLAVQFRVADTNMKHAVLVAIACAALLTGCAKKYTTPPRVTVEEVCQEFGLEIERPDARRWELDVTRSGDFAAINFITNTSPVKEFGIAISPSAHESAADPEAQNQLKQSIVHLDKVNEEWVTQSDGEPAYHMNYEALADGSRNYGCASLFLANGYMYAAIVSRYGKPASSDRELLSLLEAVHVVDLHASP